MTDPIDQLAAAPDLVKPLAALRDDIWEALTDSIDMGWSPSVGADAILGNVAMVAAAPDMLAALVEAEKHFGPFSEITINGEHDPDDVRVVAAIRASIAKAIGAVVGRQVQS